jgi:hypothetical protein
MVHDLDAADPPPPPHLGPAALARLLPFGALADALRDAFAAPAPTPPFPPRTHVPTGPEGDTLVMIAWTEQHLLHKVIHVRRGNSSIVGAVIAAPQERGGR